jgi:hypothetical protein
MIPLSRAHAVRELQLFLGGGSSGRYDSRYHSGVHAGPCARDVQEAEEPTAPGMPVQRLIIGTIRFSKETGEVIK